MNKTADMNHAKDGEKSNQVPIFPPNFSSVGIPSSSENDNGAPHSKVVHSVGVFGYGSSSRVPDLPAMAPRSTPPSTRGSPSEAQSSLGGGGDSGENPHHLSHSPPHSSPPPRGVHDDHLRHLLRHFHVENNSNSNNTESSSLSESSFPSKASSRAQNSLSALPNTSDSSSRSLKVIVADAENSPGKPTSSSGGGSGSSSSNCSSSDLNASSGGKEASASEVRRMWEVLQEAINQRRSHGDDNKKEKEQKEKERKEKETKIGSSVACKESAQGPSAWLPPSSTLKEMKNNAVEPSSNPTSRDTPGKDKECPSSGSFSASSKEVALNRKVPSNKTTGAMKRTTMTMNNSILSSSSSSSPTTTTSSTTSVAKKGRGAPPASVDQGKSESRGQRKTAAAAAPHHDASEEPRVSSFASSLQESTPNPNPNPNPTASSSLEISSPPTKGSHKDEKSRTAAITPTIKTTEKKTDSAAATASASDGSRMGATSAVCERPGTNAGHSSSSKNNTNKNTTSSSTTANPSHPSSKTKGGNENRVKKETNASTATTTATPTVARTIPSSNSRSGSTNSSNNHGHPTPQRMDPGVAEPSAVNRSVTRTQSTAGARRRVSDGKDEGQPPHSQSGTGSHNPSKRHDGKGGVTVAPSGKKNDVGGEEDANTSRKNRTMNGKSNAAPASVGLTGPNNQLTKSNEEENASSKSAAKQKAFSPSSSSLPKGEETQTVSAPSKGEGKQRVGDSATVGTWKDSSLTKNKKEGKAENAMNTNTDFTMITALPMGVATTVKEENNINNGRPSPNLGKQKLSSSAFPIPFHAHFYAEPQKPPSPPMKIKVECSSLKTDDTLQTVSIPDEHKAGVQKTSCANGMDEMNMKSREHLASTSSLMPGATSFLSLWKEEIGRNPTSTLAQSQNTSTQMTAESSSENNNNKDNNRNHGNMNDVHRNTNPHTRDTNSTTSLHATTLTNNIIDSPLTSLGQKDVVEEGSRYDEEGNGKSGIVRGDATKEGGVKGWDYIIKKLTGKGGGQGRGRETDREGKNERSESTMLHKSSPPTHGCANPCRSSDSHSPSNPMVTITTSSSASTSHVRSSPSYQHSPYSPTYALEEEEKVETAFPTSCQNPRTGLSSSKEANSSLHSILTEEKLRRLFSCLVVGKRSPSQGPSSPSSDYQNGKPSFSSSSPPPPSHLPKEGSSSPVTDVGSRNTSHRHSSRGSNSKGNGDDVSACNRSTVSGGGVSSSTSVAAFPSVPRHRHESLAHPTSTSTCTNTRPKVGSPPSSLSHSSKEEMMKKLASATTATTTTNNSTRRNDTGTEAMPFSTPNNSFSVLQGLNLSNLPSDQLNSLPFGGANSYLLTAFEKTPEEEERGYRVPIDNFHVESPIIRTLPHVHPPSKDAVTGGRVIIVGDVHGCAEQLEALLQKVHFDVQSDQLVMVGDLVNKGPDSVGVVRVCQKYKAVGVVGNHDVTLLNLCAENRRRNFSTNALKDPVKRCAVSFPSDCEMYLRQLPHIIRIPQYNLVVVHAGIDPRRSLEDQTVHNILHIRRIATGEEGGEAAAGMPSSPCFSSPEAKLNERLASAKEKSMNSQPSGSSSSLLPEDATSADTKGPPGLQRAKGAGKAPPREDGVVIKGDEGVLWGRLYNGPETIIFGHAAQSSYQQHPFAIGIDTGCVYGNALTCIIFSPMCKNGMFAAVEGLENGYFSTNRLSPGTLNMRDPLLLLPAEAVERSIARPMPRMSPCYPVPYSSSIIAYPTTTTTSSPLGVEGVGDSAGASRGGTGLASSFPSPVAGKLPFPASTATSSRNSHAAGGDGAYSLSDALLEYRSPTKPSSFSCTPCAGTQGKGSSASGLSHSALGLSSDGMGGSVANPFVSFIYNPDAANGQRCTPVSLSTQSASSTGAMLQNRCFSPLLEAGRSRASPVLDSGRGGSGASSSSSLSGIGVALPPRSLATMTPSSISKSLQEEMDKTSKNGSHTNPNNPSGANSAPVGVFPRHRGPSAATPRSPSSVSISATTRSSMSTPFDTYVRGNYPKMSERMGAGGGHHTPFTLTDTSANTKIVLRTSSSSSIPTPSTSVCSSFGSPRDHTRRVISGTLLTLVGRKQYSAVARLLETPSYNTVVDELMEEAKMEDEEQQKREGVQIRCDENSHEHNTKNGQTMPCTEQFWVPLTESLLQIRPSLIASSSAAATEDAFLTSRKTISDTNENSLSIKDAEELLLFALHACDELKILQKHFFPLLSLIAKITPAEQKGNEKEGKGCQTEYIDENNFPSFTTRKYAQLIVKEAS